MRSPTEARNPNTTHIDKASTVEMLELIQVENVNAAKAVEKAMPMIANAVDEIVKRMKKGGRIIYIGAGSSGRLGVIDAVECPPTYGVDSDLVSGVIAGGYDCMFRAAEGAEDNAESGIRDISAKNLTENDCIVGISAAGNAAYVADALKYAQGLGCATVGLTCNPESRLAKETMLPIITDTGAEAVTGSTRMKAATAHKMVVNMLSTCAMIQTGKVYENLMINLRPSNIKLKQRVISIVCQICDCDEDKAVELLDANEWCIRTAVEAYKNSK